jgi:ATP-binding cassette subfamily B protein
LLKNADVLLLDEPTSALDAETAGAVSRSIFQNFPGKTIVTVTHELAFVSEADQIIVLDAGKVVGCGRHEELLERCDTYRGLVEEQSYQEVFA